MPSGSGRKLVSSGKVDELTPAQYVKRVEVESKIQLRHSTVGFLQKAYGFSLFGSYLIIILQGFHLGGFHLPEEFLKWLGGVTIAQTAGLLALTIKQFLK